MDPMVEEFMKFFASQGATFVDAKTGEEITVLEEEEDGDE